jgi:predicted TPR repeat methyltransferase
MLMKLHYLKVSCEAPRIAATQVESLFEPSRRSDVTIIDVGAGTGLVGEKVRFNLW